MAMRAWTSLCYCVLFGSVLTLGAPPSDTPISQKYMALWSRLQSQQNLGPTIAHATLESFRDSLPPVGACGWLSALKVHPTNASKLIGNGFLTGRIYEVDVVTGRYDVLTHMIFPHGLHVTQDALYMTEIALGRVARYDFATGDVSNAFPSNPFVFPARLLGIDEATFLVTEPVLGRVLKLSSDGSSWHHEKFAGGMVMPDAVTWGPEGELLVAAWSEHSLGGQLYVVNASTGEVKETIMSSGLDLPTGLRYHQGKIYVAEMGPLRNHRVSVLAQDPAGNWAREHTLSLAWPTGLDVGRDPTTGHAMLYVVEGLTSKLWRYDLEDGFSKTLVTEFECSSPSYV